MDAVERKMNGRIYVLVGWPAAEGDVVDWISDHGRRTSRVVVAGGSSLSVEVPPRARHRRVHRSLVTGSRLRGRRGRLMSIRPSSWRTSPRSSS